MTNAKRKAYDDALRSIAKLRRKKGTRLILANRGLTALPPEIGQLATLRALFLFNNQLTALPPEIGQLTALAELRLDRNQLTVLPPEIGQLTALRALSLHGNQLTALPPEIGQLTALSVLYLDTNRLTALPPEIGRLRALIGLFLKFNELTALPPEVGQLKALTELDLSKNLLTALPPEIAQLTALKHLYLDNNRLTVLPPEVGQLKALIELLLFNNRLTALPLEIGHLTGLRVIKLSGNPTLGLPAEMLEMEPRDILDYCFLQWRGARRSLNEVKVLVVGESEVGKTSLIRQLRGEAHNVREDKTHGIERHRVAMRCGRLGEVRLNVWDFGGQDIMHATHQFFLTHRSVYLLVLDSRQNERQSRIDYWLRLIASYGGNSPVIVVCNKADQQVMQLNWTGLQREYPQIVAFAREVSCYHHGAEDRRKGLTELQGLIAQAVERDVAEVDQPILESWLKLKDELETDGRPYLTLEEYHALAAEKGVKEQRDREILLTLMHQLGCVLHFSEHAIFAHERQRNAAPAHVEQLNVLDPGWVTGAIYKLLNDAELIRAGGVLDRESMRRSLRALPGGRYPAEKEDFILAMMRRFEICFPFDGGEERWFLPDLLHKDEVDTGDWSGALGFRYQYRVLPGSVLGRLMVRLHSHIARHCLWRTGAKFKAGACEALVRSEPEEARLDVSIRGGTARGRREFLALIRGTLAGIHASFSENLGMKELVPVAEHPGVFVGYQKLLLLEEKGTAFNAEELDGKLIEVNVADALNGLTERRTRDEERLALLQKDEGKRLANPTPTIIVHGDYNAGNKTMKDDHGIHIGGDNYGQAGQTLTNCTNMIQQMPAGEPKDLLEKLLAQLEPVRDEMKGKDIKALDEHLLKLTEEAKKPEPDRGALSLSGKGVIEAAETVGKIAKPVLATVGLLMKFFGA